MTLWTHWWNAIHVLRPGFSRQVTFFWFALCCAGLSVRSDHLGVTSIVRSLSLRGRYYRHLLECCHSRAIKLPALTALWSQAVLTLFDDRVERVNGRPVLIVDGKKAGKEGKRMPGVKSLFQESESNSKSSFIMGHSWQAVSLLVRASEAFFACPLSIRLHEGVIFSNRDKRTTLDMMIGLVDELRIDDSCYIVADRFYASSKLIKQVLRQGNHLITRAKSDCAACYAPPKRSGKPKRGRPQKYGRRVKVRNLFRSTNKVQRIDSPLYGEKGITLKVRTVDLLWKPAGQLVRFVLVEHPRRGRWMLMCSDLTLDAASIVRLYGLRFKIELGFKQAVHTLGSFNYHFWMADMKRIKRRGGNQYMHHERSAYRDKVRRKLHAYHVFMMMGVITQGLMHYLSACHAQLVWQSFGSWLRTIRKGVAPTELVVASALRNTLPAFIRISSKSNRLAKFIADRQDPDRAPPWQNAA